jgi:hypothetical protein
MPTNFTSLTNGQFATAATFNAPLTQLDTAIENLVSGVKTFSGLTATGISTLRDGINVTTTTGATTAFLELGTGRSGSGASYLDLVGDTTYSDFGTRLIRQSGGANTNTQLAHRGTGALQLIAQDAGSIELATNSVVRLSISGAGGIGFYGATPVARPTYTAPTGIATRSGFATGSVTLSVLAEHVKAMIDDLRGCGLFG